MIRLMFFPIALAVAILILLFLATADDAGAHYQPGLHNTRHAINQAWCGKANRYCWQGTQAWQVAHCETGGTFSVHARNGQYLGLWQMGEWERDTYGHGWNPWAQAFAAHRYYVFTGRDWSPWSCRP